MCVLGEGGEGNKKTKQYQTRTRMGPSHASVKYATFFETVSPNHKLKFSRGGGGGGGGDCVVSIEDEITRLGQPES